jgi:hypothetical protein
MLVRSAALCAVLLVGLSAIADSGARGGAAARPLFHFEVEEGQNLNYFLRDGMTAAHLLLRSGRDPRILVAFPAGNSGVGLWFQSVQPAAAKWFVNSAPAAIVSPDSAGRPLYGITFEASIVAKSLVVKQTVLSSIRVLRDYQSLGTVPEPVVAHSQTSGNTMSWARNRLDGAPGYRLTLEVTDGAALPDGRISAGTDGGIRLRITALSGEKPLTALTGATLLNGRAAPDERARETLTFLSYREKLLAGSWRFDTYFGRDTLMSVRLLMPVLAPEAIEAGLNSVLARLCADGEVAHEEGIGEFAVLSHKLHDGTLSDAPIFDYSMVDGNYLLAPVLTAYVLESPEGKKRAAAYLAADASLPGGTRISAGQALVRNLRLLATTSRHFSTAPRFNNLISLKPGHRTGQWRDSQDGIGDGRYPYDVNAVLVPAALDAAARLLASGLLDPYIGAEDRKVLGDPAAAATVWRAHAPGLFNATVDYKHARAAIESYAGQIGVPAADALAALDRGGEGRPVSYRAISLDAAGKPVPIVNSDEAFALLFATPAAATLDSAVNSMMQPFPLGLLTGAGMLVANPVFADASLKARFTNHAYHGTVVWSWQQALFAAGLEKQLARSDLPASVRQHLLAAQKSLWQVVQATRSVGNSELWSWRYEGGHYQIAPFGAAGADADESNAAQLWSSVYLAVKAP